MKSGALTNALVLYGALVGSAFGHPLSQYTVLDSPMA
jgi:hypothetical protein